MIAINLLPWRLAVYTRRLRCFLLLLLCSAVLVAAAAVLHYSSNSRQRSDYNTRVAAQHNAITELQQEARRLQQISAGSAQVDEQLRTLRQGWQQQQAWQQIMLQWQTLSAATRITEISGRDGSLVIKGISEDMAPLRRLLHQSPRWRLQHIALDADVGFDFTVAGTLPTAGAPQ